MKQQYIIVDNIKVPINGDETNLLKVIKKAGIDIPTFCYHSSLSVYGACRLCLVDIEGRGLVTSCSTVPADGMVIKTSTPEIRETRRMITEMILANHDMTCPTCNRSDSCKLRELASRMGIEDIAYKRTKEVMPLDTLSDSLVRDPNKCVLCGDCVRYCDEIQGIGAIDFAYRGENVIVTPAFKKSMAHVDCINCGQCAAVCPTGALVIKSEIDKAWEALHDNSKTVVAQVAPAVRVAIGEAFGITDGEPLTGKIFKALRMLGFDKIFDTSFSADLTVIEEANEFLARKAKGEKLPIFTSCCPGWVKYAEQSHPEILKNLSSCMSPQSMLGSLIKKVLPEQEKIDAKDIVSISIMPCTAKKFEKNRPELSRDGNQLVDIVLTTNELGQMIKEAGIRFAELAPDSVDLPFGFTTGAGVIFGNSGGVSEAVLRYAYEDVTQQPLTHVEFDEVRGNTGIKEASINLNGTEINIAVVQGLKNAEKIAKEVSEGTCKYDIVEVMACPGGCIGGAGQPICHDEDTKAKRTEGLYNADRRLQLHKAQQNPFIAEYYQKVLGGKAGSHEAHELLHTTYKSRRRIQDASMPLIKGTEKQKLQVKVCVGTSCYLKGSQDILTSLIDDLEDNKLENFVDIKASFCTEKCDKGPTVTIGNEAIHHAKFDEVSAKIKAEIEKIRKG